VIQVVRKVDLEAAQLAAKEVELERASQASKKSQAVLGGYGSAASTEKSPAALLDVKA